MAAGGAGLSGQGGTFVHLGLAAACPTVAALMSILDIGTAMPAALARPAPRDRRLPRLVSMEAPIACCPTAPGAGSDAAALSTRAGRRAGRRAGGGRRLNGTEAVLSGAGDADARLVTAPSGGPRAGGVSAFPVAAEAAGPSFGAPGDRTGRRARGAPRVPLHGVERRAAAPIGPRGGGFAAAPAVHDGGRPDIAAGPPGTAAAALAMARAFVTETCHGIPDDCLQLRGGYGDPADRAAEKPARDRRVRRILEGAAEAMHPIVARALRDGAPA